MNMRRQRLSELSLKAISAAGKLLKRNISQIQKTITEYIDYIE